MLFVFKICLFILESNLNDLQTLRSITTNWKNSTICLPIMTEDRFVELCKTMYDLIGNSTIDQEMHNNISKISNLYTFLKYVY